MPKCRVTRHSVTQPTNESYRLIPLTRNQNAIVDKEDFEWLSQWNWCAKWSERPKTFYATRGIRPPENGRRGTHQHVIKMHREILQCAPGEQTDHINGNGLDNRRANLRKCSIAQNNLNRPGNDVSVSGYKGVCKSNRPGRRKRWLARINEKFIGMFNTPEEAARAYDEAAKKLHGEFAFLNFK